MLSPTLLLILLSCVAFSQAVYEDCLTPPPVDHGRAELRQDNEHTNTAIYSCKSGYVLKGAKKLRCNVDTEEWQGEPPSCIRHKVSPLKKKLLAIPEEPLVNAELAQRLDLSCIQAKVQAPDIAHGAVDKYERRRKGDKVFLVAYYACSENYDFEFEQVNALYCGQEQWVGETPSCVPRNELSEALDDDDDEEEDYDEYDTIEDHTTGEFMTTTTKMTPVEVPPPPPPPVLQAAAEEEEEELEPGLLIEEPMQPKTQVEEVAEPDAEPKSMPQETQPAEAEAEVEAAAEAQPATDISIVVEPTQDPYTPRVLDSNCGDDNGGCEQICERLLFPGENEPRLKCSCQTGYTLDPLTYTNCHDIDECQEANAGCAQICNNLPGSVECACEKGYQIDGSDGKSCVDVDECAQPEVAAECAGACENTPGSYRCVTPLNNKETSREEVEEHTDEEPVYEVEVQPETTTAAATITTTTTTTAATTEVRDRCQPFQAPTNGRAHCNRYRHKRKYFYTTRCKISCNAGYVLEGSATRTCGASGNWEGLSNRCQPISTGLSWFGGNSAGVLGSFGGKCAALPTPKHGVISPASCTQLGSSFGGICWLQCNMGYVPVAATRTTCVNGRWSLGSVLECKPTFDIDVEQTVQLPWRNPLTSFATPTQQQRAYIKCPENVMLLLAPGQSRAHVFLQKPATNVDYRYVEAHPPWAKQLQAHLPAGVHKIVFRAHDPLSQQTVACQTLISIKPAAPAPIAMPMPMPGVGPRFESLQEEKFMGLAASSGASFCPASFEVHLKQHQHMRSVLWKEPRFEGKLLKMYKSSFPGALFGLGDHEIKYEATTTDGQHQICIFHIYVKAAEAEPVLPKLNFEQLSAPAKLMQPSHESYVVCPGKQPVKVTAHQSVNLPVGCTLKNVRSSSRQSQLRRGLLTSLWRPYY
ncbi:frac [Drosophila busckii]|uniref:Frac n=1 Tax=Drosophila busckii TaxID=30019 RepID=A0A0M3QW21_DROBS|nr:frac [Drosophila busckii]